MMTWQEVVLENTHLHIVEKQDRRQNDTKKEEIRKKERREKARENHEVHKKERKKKKDQRKPAREKENRKITNRKEKNRKKKVIVIGPTRITQENKMRIIVSRHKNNQEHARNRNDRLKPFAYNNRADKEWKRGKERKKREKTN